MARRRVAAERPEETQLHLYFDVEITVKQMRYIEIKNRILKFPTAKGYIADFFHNHPKSFQDKLFRLDLLFPSFVAD